MLKEIAIFWDQLGRMKYLLLLIVLLHVTLLGTALWQRSYLTDDSIQYLRIAENLAQEGIYSQSYAAPFAPDYQRTPGYPIFLYLLQRQPWLILVIQHLLSLASCWLLYRILLLHFPARWATTGSLIYGIQPYAALFASYILSETLFIFCLLAWLYALLRFLGKDANVWLAISTSCLCIAILVRPVAAPLLLLMFVLVVAHRLRTRKGIVLGMAIACVLPMVLLGPTLLRNYKGTGQWSLSTMGAMGMVHGRLGGVQAWELGFGADEHALFMLGDSIAALDKGLLELREFPADKQTHETEQLAAGMTGLTLRYFMNHPIDAVLFELQTGWNMAKGVGYGWAKDLTHSAHLARLLAGLQLLLNVFSYVGCFLACVRRRHWRAIERISFWTATILLLVSSAAWADGRYRAVIDPLLVILVIFVGWNYERSQITTVDSAT